MDDGGFPDGAGGASLELRPSTDGEPLGAPAGDLDPATADERTFLTEAAGGAPDVGVLSTAGVGVTEDSQATLLLKKRKDMRMLEDALESVKKEFADRMAKLAERQARFEEKQRALQEMVAKFKPFVEENDAKRERAVLKARNEVSARERIEAEIEKLTIDLHKQRSEKDAIAEELTLLRKYAKYLEDVMAAAARGHSGVAETFESITDVLARYETLKNTNQDLHAQATRMTGELEALRSTVSSLQKRMRDTSLVAGSSAQELVTRLEAARATVADLNAQRDFAEADLRRMRATAGRTDTSIRNLYARVMATAPANSLPSITLQGVAGVLLSVPGGSNLLAAGTTDGATLMGTAAPSTAGAATAFSMAAYASASAPSTSSAVAAATAATGSPVVILQYLKQCLSVIGDRIVDLSAIVDEHPAWKEQQARERDAAARARAAAPLTSGAAAAATAPVGSGVAAVRAATGSTRKLQRAASERMVAAPMLSASSSGPGLAESSMLTSQGLHSVASSGSLGGPSAVGLSSTAMLSESHTGNAYGAAPSHVPGLFTVKFSVPSASMAPQHILNALKAGSAATAAKPSEALSASYASGMRPVAATASSSSIRVSKQPGGLKSSTVML